MYKTLGKIGEVTQKFIANVFYAKIAQGFEAFFTSK